MVRFLPIALAILCGLGFAADKLGLEQPLSSSPAKRYRQRGLALWESIQPTWKKHLEHKPIPAKEATAAVEVLEQVALDLERSLQLEWDTATNRTLADAARGWYAFRKLVPPPAEPTDPKERKKAENARAKERRARLSAARRFVMGLAKARRYENIFKRCPRCDGRKFLRSPFGDRYACPLCHQRGVLLDRQDLLRARWLAYSPLFRDDGRNRSRMDRQLHMATDRRESVGPFVKSVVVDGPIEDHDLWVRVHTKEKTFVDPVKRATEKAKGDYLLLRVGKLWYLYTERQDHDLIEIKVSDSGPGGSSAGASGARR